MARPTVATIDLDALAHNVGAVRNLVGQRKIIAAVKADAYGHGAPVVSRALSAAGVDMFGVAMTEEAVDLRQAGIRKPIILLTSVPSQDIDALLRYGVSACVADEAFARDLAAAAVRRDTVAPVHVNVDTGMHRMGLDWEGAARSILKISRLAGLRASGIFSHFACSDADDLSFSLEQVRRFKSVLRELRRAGMELPLIHMANSNAVQRLPEAYFGAVRPGLMLYGLCSRPRPTPGVELKPVLSMRTRIVRLHELPTGTKIGYGHTFTTWRQSTIATLPVGYHDGYVRQFSNRGEVLVRGRRAAVVGRVCMDQTLVDVTDVPGVKVGDEVVLYGEQDGASIHVEQMAALVDCIPYELTCAVGPRVRRKFVKNGAVVAVTPFRSLTPSEPLREGFLSSAAPSDEAPGAGLAQPEAA
ncbi:MAG: alanine racemase [Planctomycetes bacterium]|nr:alanine racemase [Planctomycetota bacterium]